MVSVQRATVPAVVSELVLALPDPLLGSLADGLHQVRMPLAELPLLVHQAGNVVTYHPSTQGSNIPADTQPEVSKSDKLKNRISPCFKWFCIPWKTFVSY